MTRISVYRCPEHRRFVSVVVQLEHCGRRVLGETCCPALYTQCLASWPLTRAVARDISDAIDLALNFRDVHATTADLPLRVEEEKP